MQVKEVDQKKVAAIKGQTTRMQAQVEALEIKDDATQQTASELRSRIKTYERAMAKEKKEWLDPINVLRNKIFSVFRPFEAQVAQAIKAVDTKIIGYQELKEKEAREQEAKLQARVDKGTLKPETALRKMEDVDVPDTMIESTHGKTIIQERRDVEIVDLAKIPREYLLVDMVLLRNAMLVEGKQVPGAKVITKKVLSSR